MTYLERIPERNDFGLVVPPSPEELAYLSLFRQPKHKPETVDRHHLYWPESLYKNNELAKAFYSHRFNSVWMLRSDHRSVHDAYDGVPVPPRDVMTAFLHEAKILDGLGVCVSAVEMIDEAIYGGCVLKPRSIERRLQHLETISTNVRQINEFEIMPLQVVELVVRQLGELPVAA